MLLSFSIFFFLILFNVKNTKKVILFIFVNYFIKWIINIIVFRCAYQKFYKHIVGYKFFFAYCNFLKLRQFIINNSISFINLLKNQQFNVIDVFTIIKRFFNVFENEQQSIKTFNFFFLIIKSRNFSLFFNIQRRNFFVN